MKKLFILILVAVLGSWGFHSCNKAPLMTFRSESNVYFKTNLDSVYFGVRNAAGNFVFGGYTFIAVDTLAMDTMTTNFGFFSDTASVLCIRVQVSAMGDTMANDRSFSLTVDPSSNADPAIYSFDPSTCKIPHGRLTAYVPVYIKRDASLKRGNHYITFNLKSNENFGIEYKGEKSVNYKDKYKSALSRTYAIADNIPRPTWWGVGTNTIGYSCFQGFSTTKISLLMNELNVPLGFLMSNTPDLGLLFGLASKYNCYLAEQRRAGHPIMDMDDETGVSFEMKPSVSGGTACE